MKLRRKFAVKNQENETLTTSQCKAKAERISNLVLSKYNMKWQDLKNEGELFCGTILENTSTMIIISLHKEYFPSKMLTDMKHILELNFKNVTSTDNECWYQLRITA